MTIKLYSKLTPVNSKFNFANKNYLKKSFSRKITKPSSGAAAYSGLTLSYNFTSNNATVVFNGVTISGNVGGVPSSPYSAAAGGTYTITNNNGFCGGVNGGGSSAGSSGTSFFTGSGTGGGAPGGGSGSGSTGGSFADVSGFLAAYAAAGYTAGGSFGKGGNGSTGAGANGNIPGGGGSGGGNQNSGYTNGGTGANGMILVQYTVNGTNTYQLINQASGAGSITFPTGTSYVKAWAIGKGGNGDVGNKDLTNNIFWNGAGGGGGGFAYAVFN